MKTFKKYESLIEELDYQWNWCQGQKKIIFDEYAAISFSLQNDIQNPGSQIDFFTKNRSFFQKKPPSMTLIANQSLKNQYQNISNYKEENFEHLRNKNPEVLEELENVMHRLKGSLPVEKGLSSNHLTSEQYFNKKIGNLRSEGSQKFIDQQMRISDENFTSQKDPKILNIKTLESNLVRSPT